MDWCFFCPQHTSGFSFLYSACSAKSFFYWEKEACFVQISRMKLRQKRKPAVARLVDGKGSEIFVFTSL